MRPDWSAASLICQAGSAKYLAVAKFLASPTTRLLGVALSLFVTVEARGQQPIAEVVVRNTSVLDVQRAVWLPGHDIIVRGTRIAEVRPTGSPLPPAKVTLKGEGKFAMPGLFDNRVHLAAFTPAEAGTLVAHGITSVWDAGSDPRRIAEWQQAISHGKFMGPRIVGSDQAAAASDLPASGADAGAAGGLLLHDVLARMVRGSGMAPAAAIARATIRSAAFHGRERDLGSIEPGKIADLLILTGDPLADITQTRSIDAVIYRGEVLSRAHLNMLLTASRQARGDRR